MELLDVLNDKGEKTGKVLNKERIHNEGLYHREVALILINDEGKLLLQKRASSKRIEPDVWAWHGGHVKAGEECIEAIIRETKEELGIEIPKNKINFLLELKRDKMPNKQFTTVYYSICNLPLKKFKIQKEELSEVKWFNYSEFKNMIYSNDPDIMFNNNKNTKKIISSLEKIIKIS